ncbi:uncharacterized protein LOC124941198 [Impatiens glandulifera]|uniref:uncharacterized protein LOC124941198 n=1 Tax=Impatiens glandulifera TaxID=253017 RepID=UPI001FB11038|nr:uncharacterized protein LOC124941198 [Impatiens glandulifera]
MFYSFHSIKNFNESVAMEFMTRFIMKFMIMMEYIELRVCLINPPSLMILSSKQEKSIQPYLLNMIFLPVIFWVFSVIPGDVIIVGSDGLFARQSGDDKMRSTLFSTAAQNAGFRYSGGKLDDITVVVSFVKENAPRPSTFGYR